MPGYPAQALDGGRLVPVQAWEPHTSPGRIADPLDVQGRNINVTNHLRERWKWLTEMVLYEPETVGLVVTGDSCSPPQQAIDGSATVEVDPSVIGGWWRTVLCQVELKPVAHKPRSFRIEVIRHKAIMACWADREVLVRSDLGLNLSGFRRSVLGDPDHPDPFVTSSHGSAAEWGALAHIREVVRSRTVRPGRSQRWMPIAVPHDIHPSQGDALIHSRPAGSVGHRRPETFGRPHATMSV